ncbi:MAG: GntR family transcriptional regulator [Phycisphaerales bacterium]|nr:MAG: GntR family transcriptional regulator [Phycisphaerales bacterium]
MLLQIDHHSGQPIYRQVAEQIRRQILAGHLAEGEQLVSVRELAGQLKVNPMTISKAYGLLEAEGLLERRRGVGLFIARVRPDRRSAGKSQLLEQILAKAVAAAVQFDIPETEVHALTERLFERYSSRIRRDEHE